MVDLDRIHVLYRGMLGGVHFLLLIQGPEILRDLIYIVPEMVGRPHRCIRVPTFQYGVRPAKFGPAQCRLKTLPYLFCGILGPSLIVHKKVLSHGFSDSPCHVAFLERVSA